MTHLRALGALLGLALVSVSGCDAGNAEPTLYAPDDLASVLPLEIGDVTLAMEGSGGSDYLAEALGAENLASLLRSHEGLGYDPDRVSFALASTSTDMNEPRLVVLAVRVDDVPSWDLGGLIGNRLAESLTGTGLPTGPGAFQYAAQRIGEVLFGAAVTSGELGVSAVDAKAEFPTCERKGKEFLEPCHAPS